jgi:hypothetical protein
MPIVSDGRVQAPASGWLAAMACVSLSDSRSRGWGRTAGGRPHVHHLSRNVALSRSSLICPGAWPAGRKAPTRQGIHTSSDQASPSPNSITAPSPRTEFPRFVAPYQAGWSAAYRASCCKDVTCTCSLSGGGRWFVRCMSSVAEAMTGGWTSYKVVLPPHRGGCKLGCCRLEERRCWSAYLTQVFRIIRERNLLLTKACFFLRHVIVLLNYLHYSVTSVLPCFRLAATDRIYCKQLLNYSVCATEDRLYLLTGKVLVLTQLQQLHWPGAYLLNCVVFSWLNLFLSSSTSARVQFG